MKRGAGHGWMKSGQEETGGGVMRHGMEKKRRKSIFTGRLEVPSLPPAMYQYCVGAWRWVQYSLDPLHTNIDMILTMILIM